MKKILGALLALFASAAFGTTLVPIQLLNPTGSTSGQAIVSTGASSAPAWGGVGVNGIAAIAANTVLANATGSSASPTAFAMPSCSTSASLLQYTSGTGFTCNSSAGGRLINIQIFTNGSCSGGCTYTATAGTNSVIVEDAAGGGSGGASQATSSGQSSPAGGGSSGAYAKVRFTSGFSGVTVTVGGGGAAPAAGANPGNTGGTTTFGSLISCAGGTSGASSLLTANGTVTLMGAPPAACTISGGTTIVNVGGYGGAFGITLAPGTSSTSGQGGSGPLGEGGGSRGSLGAALAGTGFGSGSGGANTPAASSAAQAGTAAQPGIVIVYEYN